jgi:hypothetical protein
MPAMKPIRAPWRAGAACALVCLAGLAGCSTAPMADFDQGKRHEFSVASEPQALANCIADNALVPAGFYTASVSRQVRPDSYEVIVTEAVMQPVNINYRRVIVVARTSPLQSNARLEIFLSNGLSAADADDWLARLRRGCWS